MQRYRWAAWGDVNAFFGLMLDNVAVLIFLVVLITGVSDDRKFSREFVLTHLIPGTVLGVVLGDVTYTWLAFRLARRTGRTDVTAMPLGLDTPSTFAVGPLVLLPALALGLDDYQLPHDQAMFFAWHVAALVLVMIGLGKSLVAPFGEAVRRWVPRAGLLGSLAAIALVLIAFMPLSRHIASVPLVGIAVLTVIFVTLVAHRRLPWNVPGALAAVLVGVGLYWLLAGIGSLTGAALVPPLHAQTAETARQTFALVPDFAQNWDWWHAVLSEAAGFLPLMLPFGLATVVGGIDCTESAAAAGDEYDTRTILMTEGLASVAAGLCGGVIQNTPYIGQPAYKAMGGRAAYTLATALFVGAAGLFGWFGHLFEWLPEAAMMPVLVFIGLEITAQSFKATPVRHYPALALAALPALAYLAYVIARPPGNTPAGLALRCLANGFIITSLLWASALAAILDDKLRGAAVFLLVAGLFALFGIIHSPLEPALIDWPGAVIAHMTITNPALFSQSPVHWCGAYLLAALILLGLSFTRNQESGVRDQLHPDS